LYLFEFSDFFTTTLEIDIFLSELDIRAVATIFYRDFFLLPVVDIAISFLIDLGSDESLGFFFGDIIEVDIFRDIYIEGLPLEKRSESSLSLGIWLTIMIPNWCVSDFFLLDEFDSAFSVDSVRILTTRNRYKRFSPLHVRAESSLSDNKGF
jgi:hypothetical protein